MQNQNAAAWNQPGFGGTKNAATTKPIDNPSSPRADDFVFRVLDDSNSENSGTGKPMIERLLCPPEGEVRERFQPLRNF